MTEQQNIPGQVQPKMPADEHRMDPAPDYTPRHPGVGKLKGKRAIVTGGDSGIGRAVSVLFAREGASVGIIYLDEHKDAEDTLKLIAAEGAEGFSVSADLGRRDEAFRAVGELAGQLGGLDVLVNNASMQFEQTDLRDITEEQLRRTMDSNVMNYFFTTQAALDHLPDGAAIVNTASVNAFKGNDTLVDYATSRGAASAFSRSIAKQLAPRGIRVNAVAPGPVWTPFIPGSLPEKKVEDFGSHVPMGRAGQPWEIATSYLFLASDDGNYFTGQTLHPNGGTIVGS